MSRRVFHPLVLAMLALLAWACDRGKGGSDERVIVQSRGSDTLLEVARAWAEEYRKIKPGVAVAVTGGGSGAGISAMISGTVEIANSSRKMSAAEVEMARANGIEAVEFVVAYDALAVYLHKDNPVQELTVAQLRGIYGEGGANERWSELGAVVPGCASGEIVRVGRPANSGTFAYFKESVLGASIDFKVGSRDMLGSGDVVDLVQNTPCAIGYSGFAYATEHVAMPCVAKTESDSCVHPSIVSASDGSYAISRPLLFYTAGQPRGAVKEYIEWVLSDEGQCLISERGYAPASEVVCG